MRVRQRLRRGKRPRHKHVAHRKFLSRGNRYAPAASVLEFDADPRSLKDRVEPADFFCDIFFWDIFSWDIFSWDIFGYRAGMSREQHTRQ
jgi:hypothetical protein